MCVTGPIRRTVEALPDRGGTAGRGVMAGGEAVESSDASDTTGNFVTLEVSGIAP
jgi:hypothetical protein